MGYGQQDEAGRPEETDRICHFFGRRAHGKPRLIFYAVSFSSCSARLGLLFYA
jgi:hypothetical protein